MLEHGARSGVTTPIVGPDGPWGVLGVHSLTPGRFTPDQIALLDTFANVLGSAISRRGVEIAVRDRDDRLELALAASKTGFWEWNVQSGRVVWSDEICRLHGMPPGTELPNLDAYLALVHEDDRGWVGERIHRAAETGAYDARFRIVHPDGTIRWTHGTAKVFFDPQHKAIRMIGVARDVTEEVELEGERLRMAEAERRQTELNQAFIGVVSHELRTPITSIYGGSKLLRRMGEEQSEKRSELTADIEAEAERLYRLTEDLLVLTRVERGTLDIGLEPVAMPRVLERVIASEQERWPLTTIELGVQPGIPIALGDNTYIEQLIRNLVGNAAKYAPQGGTVQVAATATQPTCRVARRSRSGSSTAAGPRRGGHRAPVRPVLPIAAHGEEGSGRRHRAVRLEPPRPGDGRPAVGEEPPEAGPSSASACGRTSPRNERQRLSPASGAPDRLRGRGRPLGNVVASGRKPS